MLNLNLLAHAHGMNLITNYLGTLPESRNPLKDSGLWTGFVFGAGALVIAGVMIGTLLVAVVKHSFLHVLSLLL